MKIALFALIFVVAGIAVSIWGWNEMESAKASMGWPTTEGTVISSEVEKHRSTTGTGSKRRTSTTYEAEVLYEYAANGTTYSSTRVSFGGSGGSSSQAREIVNRYPKGKMVSVHFDPEQPDVSVLEPGVSFGCYVPIGIGVVFTVVGICVFLGGVLRRH